MSGESAIKAAGSSSVDAPIARRTDPRAFLVRATAMMGQLAIPIVIASLTIFDEGDLGDWMLYFLPIVLVVVGANIAFAYLHWLRLTYITGAEDIRVESGIISRSARSVPYERIQDVSLEQKLLPRLFGLVEVKFETGAGGGEDLKLAYLSEADGEALRRLVRARREEDAAEAAASGTQEIETAEAGEHGEVLFAMDAKRLTTFGLFEFSLAVFAVIGGLFQYADTFIGVELWDPELWLGFAQSQQGWIESLGPAVQVISAIAGLIALLLVGSVTGLVRTFLRDWGFVLEKTARGFRRRRGLFTRTDVVMPVHRVQALELGTGLLRYRFGWHGLKFVSLAQDAGSSSHVVAPFAHLEEIEPIIHAAGFAPPTDELDWRRASRNYRFDSAALEGGLFALAAIPVAILAPAPFVLAPLALALGSVAANLYAWQFNRHALSVKQVFARRGWFSPRTQVASRVKLHSVEIAQGPIAQRRGYATLHLGLAGGTLAIPGIPFARARELRAAIIESIAAKDFSQLT